LAKEKGTFLTKEDSRYMENEVPYDWYNFNVDKLVIQRKNNMPWDKLKADLRKYGIRNSTLMALMPSETSSQISNATNGIEPPRSLVSIKQSKDGVLKQVVPEIRRLKNKYDLLWDQKSPLGYLKIMAVLQKYVDQAISVNTSYNPKFYEDEKIPLSEMIQHLLFFYKHGGKNLYYNNVFDGAGEMKPVIPDTKIEGIVEEENCDACQI
jgi:ribonucleoside-diphosphate reductase alpha chain